MRFRSVIFWFHLSAAVLAGVPILIFCFSGAVLASHDQVLDWAERDVRRPGAPAASTARLTFHEALATASRSQPARAAHLSRGLGDGLPEPAGGRHHRPHRLKGSRRRDHPDHRGSQELVREPVHR